MATFYLLQVNRLEYDSVLYEYNEESDSHSQFFHAFVNQVFLVMGDFGKTHLNRSDLNLEYPEKAYVFTENILVYFLWVASIFLIQIVLFNMLIAIMA